VFLSLRLQVVKKKVLREILPEVRNWIIFVITGQKNETLTLAYILSAVLYYRQCTFFFLYM